jgi:hypothetical protein
MNEVAGPVIELRFDTGGTADAHSGRLSAMRWKMPSWKNLPGIV